jgi:predicted phosphodiesterase
MVLGIISDIHSNLEAIKTVLNELSLRGVERIICLGDIVGYGANPNECCELIREVAECVIMGNHDAGSIGLAELSSFNEIAASACMWTANILSPENKSWLKNLPLIIEEEGKIFVHSTPSNPQIWEYVYSLGDAINEFKLSDFGICFLGHSHVPSFFMNHGTQYTILHGEKHTLIPGTRYIINPGSVGQPRDDDPRASFAIYDLDKNEIQLIKLPYNIAKAQQKIMNAGLPESLAYRLMVGR